MDRQIQPYLDLLRSYGRVLDLSSGRVLEDPTALVEAVQAYAELLPPGVTVLDLGAGGGWPGLPLALLRPDLTLHLVERRKKRAAFLDLARVRLGLANVRVYPRDVREMEGAYRYVVAQAVAPFPDLYRLVRPVAGYPLVLASVKGTGWPDEVRELGRRVPVEVFHVKPLAQGGTLVGVRVEEA